MLRFKIQVFSHSKTALLAAFSAAAAALCSASGCSVYDTGLLDSSALAAGGISGANGEHGGGGSVLEESGGEAGAADASPGGAPEVAGAAGTAGSSKGGAPAGGNGGSAAGANNGGGGAAVQVDPDLIDDLEDGDNQVLIINSPRRDGIWDTGERYAAADMQTPAQFMFKPIALAAADAPHANDQYAAYTKGSGFAMYGAYMNVSMRSYADYASTPQYDASKYSGLSFLAKAGAGSTTKMRVRFVSGDTDPRGGKCQTSGAQSVLCYNHYFADVTLTQAWATYTLDFNADFMQGGDGMVNPTIDLAGMYGLEFFFNPSTTFEVWIDDLRFVK